MGTTNLRPSPRRCQPTTSVAVAVGSFAAIASAHIRSATPSARALCAWGPPAEAMAIVTAKKKPQDEEEPEVGLPVPPDGGWGWMVVFGSFMIHIISEYTWMWGFGAFGAGFLWVCCRKLANFDVFFAHSAYIFDHTWLVTLSMLWVNQFSQLCAILSGL